MIDYTEQSPKELARLEAIAHTEGRATEAALLDALAKVMNERDALQDELEQCELSKEQLDDIVQAVRRATGDA